MSDRRFEGKAVVVTGGSSGIGAAAARLFREEGGRVCIVDRDPPSSGELFVQADLGDGVAAEGALRACLDRLGGLDVLFNNAGINRRGSVHQLAAEDWQAVFAVNLHAIFHACRVAVPAMLARGSGAIVNTASTFGILARPAMAAYCASKAAVISLTRQMALDYGPAIRVNCVCPGATETPLLAEGERLSGNPAAARQSNEAMNAALRRLGQPEEIARAVLYLASDDASFVTGHALVIDGGQTIDA